MYYLHNSQYTYHDCVINFPQNVLKFVIYLPYHPSTLDILIICYQFSNDKAFKDFNIH